jgi:hypothetical protein
MSEVNGIFSAIGVPIADAVAQHNAKQPQQKNLILVGCSASGLAWCVYLYEGFAGPVVQAPATPSHDAWVMAGIWLGAAAVALLVLLLALRAACGQRDPLAAFWRLALAGAAAALLWYRIDPDWGPVASFLLRGLYWSWLAAHLARFWAAAQPIGNREDRAARAAERERRRAEQAAREQWDAWLASVEEQNSRGWAGDGTQQEAEIHLGGQGGRHNPLDDRRF